MKEIIGIFIILTSTLVNAEQVHSHKVYMHNLYDACKATVDNKILEYSDVDKLNNNEEYKEKFLFYVKQSGICINYFVGLKDGLDITKGKDMFFCPPQQYPSKDLAESFVDIIESNPKLLDDSDRKTIIMATLLLKYPCKDKPLNSE